MKVNFTRIAITKILSQCYRLVRRALFAITNSIKYRMIFLLIIFSLLPLMTLGVASYTISKTAIDNKVMEYSRQLIRQTGQNIDIKLSVYQDFMMTVISNPDILKKLREVDKSGVNQRFVDDLSLTTKLAYFLSVTQEFKTISFITQKHYIKGIARWDDKSNGQIFTIYADTIKANNSFLWLPTWECYYYESTKAYKENVFSLTKQVFNISDGSSLGMVAVIDIREEVLSDICSKNNRENLSINSFIIDNAGTILSHPDKKFLYKNINTYFGENNVQKMLNPDVEEASLEAKYEGRNVLVNYYKLASNDWRIINVIDKDTIYKESNQVIRIIMIIALLSLFFSIITAYIIAKTISKPLKGMVSIMGQVVAGNLKVRIQNADIKRSHDEIGVLQNSFNYMIAKIEDLINEVHEEQNNKRIAEIKALEAQINPHFLYNTLDTIKWTALFQKANNAAEMASMLSRLLHISLGRGRETVKVLEEIEHVKCYVGIQKFRFNFNFEMRYNIEENTKSLKTPKLILQPIVENAILHGLVERPEGGLIIINCFQDGAKLKFEIIDNGCGFDMGEINIMRESKRKSGEIFSGIGIANVDERIKLICGKEYGIRIESQSGEGTKVEIQLPIIE